MSRKDAHYREHLVGIPHLSTEQAERLAYRDVEHADIDAVVRLAAAEIRERNLEAMKGKQVAGGQCGRPRLFSQGGVRRAGSSVGSK